MKNKRKGRLIKKLERQVCGIFSTKNGWLLISNENMLASPIAYIVIVPRANVRTSNMLEKPNNNNRTLLVGPSFSGERDLTLKILSRIPDRHIYIITESPLEQYSISEIKIKEMTEEKNL